MAGFPAINVVILASGAPAVQLCGPNPLREALAIIGQTSGSVYAVPDPTVPWQAGLNIDSNVFMILFSAKLHGDICRSAWYAIPSNMGFSAEILVMESILEPTDQQLAGTSNAPVDGTTTITNTTNNVTTNNGQQPPQVQPSSVVSYLSRLLPVVWGGGIGGSGDTDSC